MHAMKTSSKSRKSSDGGGKKGGAKGKQKRGEEDEPDIPWQFSEAKKLLRQDMIDGKVPLEDDGSMDMKDVYNQRVEFTMYSFRLFPQRLNACREQVKRDIDRKKDDQLAFDNYIANHQPSCQSHHGYPEWAGHTAQARLREDIKSKKLDTHSPKELWMSDEVYLDFPLDVFRDHIYQEIRTDKYYRTLELHGKWQRPTE